MKLPLYTIEGIQKGTVEVPDSLFGVKAHSDLVWQAATTAMANLRRPYAHAKDRSEVSGGGRKPWKQKGTGRARHGSSRSPLWVGGGVTFGPRKERVFAKNINKKMAQRALLAALSSKAENGDIYVAETLEVNNKKTKEAAKFLQTILHNTKNDKKGKRSIIWGSKQDGEFARAFRNIEGATVSRIERINILDALNHRYAIFSEHALKEFVTVHTKSEVREKKEEKSPQRNVRTPKRAKIKSEGNK